MKISLLPFRTRLYFSFKNKNFDYFCYAVVNLLCVHQQMNCYSKSALANRQPKYNIIYKKECQAFFKNFFNFFQLFLFFPKTRKSIPIRPLSRYLFIRTRILYIICRAQGKSYIKKRALLDAFFHKILMTATASFAISRTFFALLARRRIHFARIITSCFPATFGTLHFIQIRFHQFIKTFSTFHAFILQKRHFSFAPIF